MFGIKAPGYSRLVGLIIMVVAVGALILHMRQRAMDMAGPDHRTVDISELDPADLEQPERSGDFTREDMLSPEEERRLLAAVQDRFPLEVFEQKTAYYYLLNKTAVLTQEEIERHIDHDAQYIDFDRQPKIIRGAAVDVSGVLLSLVRTDMDMEQSGFSHVFEGLLQDAEGRRYYFMVTDAPSAELLPGKVTIADGRGARLVGYFQQVIQYETVGGRYVAAPLIVGKRLEPRIRPVAERDARRDLIMMGVMVAVLLALTGILLFAWHRRAMRYHRMTEENLAEAREALDKLKFPPVEKESREE